MALDRREVTMQQAARIIGCSVDSVKTLVRRGEVGVMRYIDRRDGSRKKMLSQEDVEFVAEQRSFNSFSMKYRRVIVYGTDVELVYAAASTLGIAGFMVEQCTTALEALSCGGNERPVMILCGSDTFADRKVIAVNAGKLDLYGFRNPEELRPLVRWAWARVNERYETLKPAR